MRNRVHREKAEKREKGLTMFVLSHSAVSAGEDNGRYGGILAEGNRAYVLLDETAVPRENPPLSRSSSFR